MPRRARSLNVASDFRDDGGTRAWRANQATFRHPLTIDVPQRGFRAWWRRASVAEVALRSLALFLFILFVLPAYALLLGFLSSR